MARPSTLFARYIYTAPCRDCNKRTPNEENPNAPNCHMTCKSYIAYAEERRQMSEEKTRAHDLNRPIKKRRHDSNDIAWNALNKRIK